MTTPRYPSLFQLNTRVRMTELSWQLGRRATLDDLPDADLDQWAAEGFDWIWLLTVWQTGEAGRRISQTHPGWLEEFRETLPDLTLDDVGGSGFAITGYTVSRELGGDEALARLRTRLKQRGLRLMLDFVPNHMALDHPWVQSHPEYFISGTEEDLIQQPENYVRIGGANGERIFAHGRDPNFAGWPDTLQLDYTRPETQAAMRQELVRISGQCDAVRCDMAMLVLPEIFERTWGKTPPPFWPQAIAEVRAAHPDFCLMAEVYWDMEWQLQQLGFDYAYDKRLYDRLHDGDAKPVRQHLLAPLNYQDKLARFLENHDEQRAATVFPWQKHKAAAVVTYLTPGLRFFHHGQFEGFLKRIGPHLLRGPDEPVNVVIQRFYSQLLEILRRSTVRDGRWTLLESQPAWDGNWTWEDCIAFVWQHGNDSPLLIAVNFSDHQSQCRVALPIEDLASSSWQLADLLSEDCYERRGAELASTGLFLDLAPWQAAVYECSRVA